jgi:hypothetical protein
MKKSLAQKREDERVADAGALHSLQSGLTFLEEAFASVRHYTALNCIGDALKRDTPRTF